MENPLTAQTLAYRIGDRLYLNITDRCTLDCAFCPKNQGCHEVRGYDLALAHRPSAAEIKAAVSCPAAYREVVFCGYGEPTMRLKVLSEVARDIKARGGRVRLNTDGLANRVHKRNVLPELAAVVDALSVSLNAQNAAVYNRHCRPRLSGSYEAMLEFVREAPRHISDVTVTAIDGLPGVDIGACIQIASNQGVKFRRRQLDLVG